MDGAQQTETLIPAPGDLRSCLPEELEALLQQWGEPRFRAGQVFAWLHKGVSDPEEMTNLPKTLREMLARVPMGTLAEEKRQISRDGTEKVLWRCADGELVESVLMNYKYGQTVCISSQAGCRQGCAFCASAIGGLRRDLTAGELLGQVLQIKNARADEKKDGADGERALRVVLMGIGEPLDNFDNVMRFIELVSHPKGLNLSRRHISLSTCGLAGGIDALADKGYPVTLSVSLHAPDDETRNRLMPVNRTTPVETLLAACDRFFEKTGRRVSYEYLLIDGVNDGDAQAEMLCTLLRGRAAHVNLIPMNMVRGKALRPSPPDKVKHFADALSAGGLTATVRRKLGQDIDAACGQLRGKNAAERGNGELQRRL